MTTRTEFDAVIAGAGPAGTAAAVSLARAGRRVLVLEKRRSARADRCETLAPSAKPVVETVLGTLAPLPGWAVPNLGNQSIWGAPHPQAQDHFFSAYGPGICVGREGFDAALRQAALNYGAALQRGVHVVSIDRSRDRWALTLSDGRRIGTAYLVDATGRTGALGRKLGLDCSRPDPLTAYGLWFNSDRAADTDGFTRIEASPFGWWYTNRLPGRAERVVLLHSDPDLREARQARAPGGFLELLARTRLIGPLLLAEGYMPGGKVRGAPAGGTRLSQLAKDGFLAVGDAAQAYDPLSSQGIHQALASGGLAGHAIQYALANPAQSHAFLARYAEKMQHTWDTYTTGHRDYYAMEQRWPDAPFWQARQIETFLSQPITARDA